MTEHRSASHQPYGGYFQALTPEEDRELTHVGPHTPGGEYLRRFWHPVALSSELTDRPVAVQILGEELVLFRSLNGQAGLLHRHCPHRGASLEFGIVECNGLRCCYHGWLFAHDGKLLEAPAEPPTSKIKERLYQGAYRVTEYNGLVFAFMGRPDEAPPFPLFDTVEAENNKLVPFAFETPCNWVQIGDNGMDPAHASFLHMIGFPQFGSVWGGLPEFDFHETPIGMIYVTASHLGDKVWVRSNDAILPNISQSAANWIDGDHMHTFSRASMTRWKVPISDTSTLQIGWRHFNPEVDPAHQGDERKVGREAIDIVGQTKDLRPYEERQRIPSDYDVLVSQRPIAIHKTEHLGTSDRGVAMLRRLLRRGIRERTTVHHTPRADGRIATYAHDTIIRCAPGLGPHQDQLRQVSRAVTDLVMASAERNGGDREAYVRQQLQRLERGALIEASRVG